MKQLFSLRFPFKILVKVAFTLVNLCFLLLTEFRFHFLGKQWLRNRN